jgi:hypothetical protein
VVDRTATFVFFLGDRFFGTITAYVPGAVAANYHFTRAIAVQLLKAIQNSAARRDLDPISPECRILTSPTMSMPRWCGW